jgi:citrate lyase beta subunit
MEADTVIYDLEDSVAPDTKAAARSELIRFLTVILIFEMTFKHL